MLKQLLFSGGMLAAFPALAQQPILSLPDTVYFDQNWDRTAVPEDRVFARITRRGPDGKSMSTVRDYYLPSWQKQWEGKLVREQPDVAQGVCTSWYATGKLQSRGTYLQGKPQADLQRWAEDGHLIACRFKYQDALPLSTGKMGEQLSTTRSRQVFIVDLPAETVGIVYRLDIRDDGTPPISWNSAVALGAAYFNPTATLASMLATGTRTLSSASTAPTATTKCHWYIVPDLAAAEEFLQRKGLISNKPVYRQASNVCAETRELVLAPGTRRLYLCVNNDNDLTAATATVSVSALVKGCE
ncbi:toxin-antitoxin system YwqK family antitoxin [Hymenobacter cheonanensis]|uniref:toxin-antitoxin system YwqK family antitoxin n=1 Tax=Hymenobacter sp. CA2-7 TaxID=3063993 RepID=UPI002713BF22|nr:hypothetical protein [Hymenobacter sp. CA2-7]MDO7884277.1 hypothetical protein [Hymenobacter sp. CA2-7]